MYQEPQSTLKVGKAYRCRPSLNQSLITSQFLIDLNGIQIQIFNLQNYELIQSIKVIDKSDQYCAKLQLLKNNLIIVYGITKIIIVKINILNSQILTTIENPNFIQNLLTKDGFICTLSSDQQEQIKLVNCWRINCQNGQVLQKYPITQFNPPQLQQTSDQNISTSLIMSLQKLPKLYIYWINTKQMIQVDPIKSISNRFHRSRNITYVSDIDQQTYAEISGNQIYISSKKQGKQIATLIAQQQKFKCIVSSGNPKFLFSISDKGVKKWEIKLNSKPQLLAQSEKYPIQKLFFTNNPKIQIAGINTQKKYIITWQNITKCKISSYPNQIVRRILKMNQTQAFLLLEATTTQKIQDQQITKKYNKLQIYDFAKDIQIAKKSVLKFQYHIDINSAVICKQDTIRFILNQQVQQVKKYIFRWSPFCQEKKKQVKKRQVIGAKQFDFIKIYPFDRILAKNISKQQQTYSIFGIQQPTTQISLFDFGAKNLGSYDLTGNIKTIQINQQNNLYAIEQQKLSIYNLILAIGNKKNCLQKLHQIDMSINLISPINNLLLVQKNNQFLLYNNQFQLFMKQDIKQSHHQYRLFAINQNKFIIKTQKSITVWNTKTQTIQEIKDIPESQPVLTEFIDGKILISHKWINFYNIEKYTQL